MANTDHRVTILDVAGRAGVSRQTVTRAMNDMPGINAGTKERVLTVARTLGYRPSRFGRGLVRPEHHTVGLVIQELLNPYYPELASAVVGRAREHGWTVLLLDCSGIEDQRDVITPMADQFDALIGYLAMPQQELDAVLPGMPVVQIDADQETDTRDGVEFDLGPAMDEAVEYLLARGSSQPVVLDEAAPGSPSGRAETFVRAGQRHGLNPPIVYANGDWIEAGIDGANQILDTMPGTDAIMCFNDVYAFGVLKALRRAGVEVPEHMRVIGIDGLAAGTYVTPQLTTLAIDMTDVAAAAVDIVFARLDGSIADGSRGNRRRVRHQLVVRESA